MTQFFSSIYMLDSGYPLLNNAVAYCGNPKTSENLFDILEMFISYFSSKKGIPLQPLVSAKHPMTSSLTKSPTGASNVQTKF